VTPAQVSALDQKLAAFEARKGSQVAVLMVATTAPEAIEQYSIRVAAAWKLGRAEVDDGALLLVARDHRALRIEVGYGLEGALTDATSRRIIDEIIIPYFRDGDFAGGIDAGVTRMLAVIDGEPLPEPRSDRGGGANGIEALAPVLPVLFIFTVAFGAMLKRLFGQLPGALLTGGVVGVLAWFLVGIATVAGIAAIVAFALTLASRAGPGAGPVPAAVAGAVVACPAVVVVSVAAAVASGAAAPRVAGETMARMLKHLLTTRRSLRRFPRRRWRRSRRPSGRGRGAQRDPLCHGNLPGLSPPLGGT
jgi:uncharacterized protein